MTSLENYYQDNQDVILVPIRRANSENIEDALLADQEIYQEYKEKNTVDQAVRRHRERGPL